MSTSTLLWPFVDPLVAALTPEVAARIVDLRADAKLQARLDVLAEKSNEGQLTEEEREEYNRYIWAIDFISLVQAKARTLLDRKAAS